MEAFSERIAGPLWQGGGPFIVWAMHFFGVYVLVAVALEGVAWASTPVLLLPMCLRT